MEGINDSASRVLPPFLSQLVRITHKSLFTRSTRDTSTQTIAVLPHLWLREPSNFFCNLHVCPAVFTLFVSDFCLWWNQVVLALYWLNGKKLQMLFTLELWMPSTQFRDLLKCHFWSERSNNCLCSLSMFVCFFEESLHLLVVRQAKETYSKSCMHLSDYPHPWK